MMRNLLIFAVVAVVGVALHIMRGPVTETYSVPAARKMNGEIRMRRPPIVDSHKIRQHLTILFEVIQCIKFALVY